MQGSLEAKGGLRGVEGSQAGLARDVDGVACVPAGTPATQTTAVPAPAPPQDGEDYDILASHGSSVEPG